MQWDAANEGINHAIKQMLTSIKIFKVRFVNHSSQHMLCHLTIVKQNAYPLVINYIFYAFLFAIC